MMCFWIKTLLCFPNKTRNVCLCSTYRLRVCSMRSAILTNALRANSVLVGEKTMFFCAEDSGVEAGKRETERRRIEDDAFLLLDYAPGPSLSLPFLSLPA